MRTTYVVVVLIAIGASLAAVADSIKVGDKVLENVYVTEGSSSYYVSVPDDGTVLNAAKSEVDPKSVVISPDREARKALYATWLDKRKSLRGEASSAQAEAEVVNVVEPPKKEEPVEKSKTLKKVSGSGSGTGGSSGVQGSWDTAQQQYNDSIRAAREAQLEARRRNRESEKVRMLTQRQVITSESSGGSGGTNWGGGGAGGMGGFNGGRR